MVHLSWWFLSRQRAENACSEISDAKAYVIIKDLENLEYFVKPIFCCISDIFGIEMCETVPPKLPFGGAIANSTRPPSPLCCRPMFLQGFQ